MVVNQHPTLAWQVRAERVTKACAGLEQRLSKRIELLDGYARVLNMIEIEVELDTQVPDEEMIGIEQQITRLNEVEELQEQWQLQAEAQEEVRVGGLCRRWSGGRVPATVGYPLSCSSAHRCSSSYVIYRRPCVLQRITTQLLAGGKVVESGVMIW